MKTFRFTYGRAGGFFELQFESYEEAVNECGKVEQTCGWFILSNLAIPGREINLIQEVAE